MRLKRRVGVKRCVGKFRDEEGDEEGVRRVPRRRREGKGESERRLAFDFHFIPRPMVATQGTFPLTWGDLVPWGREDPLERGDGVPTSRGRSEVGTRPG